MAKDLTRTEMAYWLHRMVSLVNIKDEKERRVLADGLHIVLLANALTPLW